MNKYIDADKLKAKIDRMLDDICEADGFVQKKDEPRYDALAEVLDFLDTLDLEEEPVLKGYDEAYLNEKIAKASKTWEGVDVDKYMDEVRGREPDKSLEEAARNNADSTVVDTRIEYCGATEDVYFYTKLLDAFIAGAEWQEKRNEKTIKTAEDHAFLAGADWQKEKIIKLIQSRIAEILGDAQPNPILRAELRELIEKIKEDEE